MNSTQTYVQKRVLTKLGKETEGNKIADLIIFKLDSFPINPSVFTFIWFGLHILSNIGSKKCSLLFIITFNNRSMRKRQSHFCTFGNIQLY